MKNALPADDLIICSGCLHETPRSFTREVAGDPFQHLLEEPAFSITHPYCLGCIAPMVFEPINVKCASCGIVHSKLPATASTLDSGDALAGTYFNCECKTTIFLPGYFPKGLRLETA